MILDSIHIQNFKCIVDETFTFSSPFTVILGNNGLGKTSILEALTVCAGVFTHNAGNDQKYQRNIKRYEIRNETVNDSLEPQYPCKVEIEGAYGQMGRVWELPTWRAAKVTSAEMVKNAQQMIRNSSKVEGAQLPLFAYYSTARLWAEMSDKLDYVQQGPRTEGYGYSLAAKSSSKYFREWYKTLDKNSDKKDESTVIRLKAFNEAITSCVEDWDDIYFDFERGDIMGVHVLPNGKAERIPYSLMSDGYRSMIGLVADLAFRCIKLNPHLGADAIKETEGLVMIDELDMHLHPTWQRHVVRDLMRCFPKLQFVATTHSPFIVQSLEPNQIINMNKEVVLNHNPKTSSLEMNAMYMGVESVNGIDFSEKEKAANKFYETLMREGVTKEEVHAALDEFEKYYGDDPVLVARLKLSSIDRKLY